MKGSSLPLPHKPSVCCTICLLASHKC